MKKRSYHETSKAWKARKKRERAQKRLVATIVLVRDGNYRQLFRRFFNQCVKLEPTPLSIRLGNSIAALSAKWEDATA